MTTHETINSYFDDLEQKLEGILPCNIWSYDETKLFDDPGKKRCIDPRGCKYPGRVMNSSKIGTSIMFCSNATPEMTLPYVCYKPVHLYPQ